MKTSCTLVWAVLCALACQTTHPGISANPYPFAQYQNLADALRSYPGLLVSGPRGQEEIVVRQNVSVRSAAPLYVINDQAVGNNYFRANQLIDMAQVKQIRVLKGMSESARYGSLGTAGVILIDTGFN
ncbi:MAG: Plug domain-containing protein [Saprospiraceae bacterium]|nr:Plug domain-containing protein [Saprospiraceae bacterium]